MTTQPENKDKAEQKVSKDELSEEQLAKASGGAITETADTGLFVPIRNSTAAVSFGRNRQP